MASGVRRKFEPTTTKQKGETMSRFNYVKYDEQHKQIQETFKKMFETIEDFANLVLDDSRAKSLLLTGLEEAYMWSGKAIRDKQIGRSLKLSPDIQAPPRQHDTYRG